MHTKFLSSLIDLKSREKRVHVTPMHFFSQGHRGQYHRSHQDVRHGGEGLGRNGVSSRISLISRLAHMNKERLDQNFRNHVSPDIWSPSYSGSNPVDYNVWGTLDGKTSQRLVQGQYYERERLMRTRKL